MRPEDFEKLVNDWLDEPGREDLRRRLDEAARGEPGLAAVLDQWRRYDELLKSPASALDRVNWPAFAARIRAAVDQAAIAENRQDQALDAALRGLSGVEQRIDWARLARRISIAVDRSTRQAAQRRRLYTMVGSATAMLAAAAALLLAILPPGRPTAAKGDGLALVRVSQTPAGPAEPARGIAYAHVAVVGVTDQPPQRFFMIDPLTPAASSAGTGGYY